ncbi:MAG: exosome complex exonuclease Rrp41 [Candidatus Diapherotrites archaeon]
MAKKEKAKEKISYFDKSGKRLDGRKFDELRPVKIEAGVIPRADGSAYLEWGQNKVLVGVYGPRECVPKHKANPYRAVVQFTYRMASFSVPDRKNPRPGRREIEIGKVCGEALERAIFVERFPNTKIDVNVEILDSNAGTRVAGLVAAAVAVADAGIPMRDLVSSCSVGKFGGKVAVDLNKDEEDADDAVDIPMAILPSSGEVVLLQLDGMVKKEEWNEAVKLGMEACNKINELQKEALRRRYEKAEKEASK